MWLALAVAVTIIWAEAIASQWAKLQAACHPDSACAAFQLDASAARTLGDHDIYLSTFAVYTAVMLAVVWVVWFGLATLIIWRKPQNRGALLAAFFLVVFPVGELAFWVPSAPQPLQALPTIIAFSALYLFCLLFPTGRFAPRWTRWLAPVAVLGGISTLQSGAIGSFAFPLISLAIVAVQVYRFRSISSWVERQETKWAFLGLAMAILGVVALILPFIVATIPNGSLYSGLTITGLPAVASAIPVSIGIAVLRKRLWDIDRIINRALVYTALSMTLAAIYIGSVVALQTTFRVITGQRSDLAVAISTLVVAILFNPLRHRTQDVIARAFYRRKYDAAEVLAAFGATCRDETDLERLRGDLVRVVEETMQPQHVSIWLADLARRDDR